MNERRDFCIFLNELGLLGTGVEVGVREGRFSRSILKKWEGTLLILVDPWEAALPDAKDSTGRVGQSTMDRWHARTLRNVAKFGDRVSVWREFSESAAAKIADGSLDFVYLDANHGYDAAGRWGIVQDLRLWWQKVKPGGMFAGHDYYFARCRKNGTPEIVESEADADLDVYGVKKAVDEFAATVGATVRVTRGDPFPSWYWRKS